MRGVLCRKTSEVVWFSSLGVRFLDRPQTDLTRELSAERCTFKTNDLPSNAPN